MQQQCLLLVLLCISFLFPFCDSQEFGSTTQGQVQVWFNGGNNTGNEPFATISIEPFKQSADFDAFLLEVETQLPFIREFCNLTEEEPSRCAPWSWKVYNWRRNRIYTTQNLHGGDLLYMVPANESFIWPGLYIGHKVTVEVSETENDGTKVVRSYDLETISLTPRAFSVSDFLSERECDLVVQLGKESLAASTLGFEALLSTSERNSKTAWLWANDDPEVKRLCDRASFLTHTPVNHQEALQLLHYTGGGYYRSHCDYFGDPSCALHPNPANRFITLLFYLSDVEEGGGTNFMRVKRDDETDDPWSRDIVNVSCTTGLTVQPKRRKAMMFYNLKPEGYRNQPIGDRMSEHTACNVTKGEKWAANFWIWNHPRAGPADVERTYLELDENFVQPPTESNYFHLSNDQQFGAAVGVEGAGEVAGEATRT